MENNIISKGIAWRGRESSGIVGNGRIDRKLLWWAYVWAEVFTGGCRSHQMYTHGDDTALLVNILELCIVSKYLWM